MKKKILTFALVISMVAVMCASCRKNNENETEIAELDETVIEESITITQKIYDYENDTTADIGTEFDDTVEISSKGYTNDELIDMAFNYYEQTSNYRPSSVITDSDGDTVSIQLFDWVNDGETAHTATSEWYYVNRYTAEGTNFFDESVDLKETLIKTQ